MDRENSSSPCCSACFWDSSNLISLSLPPSQSLLLLLILLFCTTPLKPHQPSFQHVRGFPRAGQGGCLLTPGGRAE